MDSNNEMNEEFNVKEVPLNTDDTIQSDNDLQSGSQSNAKTEESVVDSQKCSTDSVMKCEPIDDNCNKNENQNDDNVTAESTQSLRHQYSKEQLIAFSKLSLARIRPKCLDNAFNNPTNGLWDPEKWMSSKCQTLISSNNKYNYNKRDGNENYVKKANNDLKDRVLEEENEIVLSPQRGSFGTGCHVSTAMATNPANRYEPKDPFFNPRNKIEETNEGSHRQNINQRRVGTGRIVPKDRDNKNNEWIDRSFERERERNYEHRNDGRSDGRENRDNRFEDYSDRRNRRFFDRRINNNSNRNNRFENERFREHNRYSREEEDEPEWFTEGPTSKHETIELKGFDDDSEHRKRNKESIEVKSSIQKIESKDSELDKQNESFVQKDIEHKVKDQRNESKSEDFDVNESFKTDDWFRNGYETPDNKLISSIGGISDNTVIECDNSGKSRFKRWFKESPTNAMTTQSNDNSQRNENIMKQSNSGQREDRGVASIPRAVAANNPTPNVFISESNERNIFDLLKGSNRISMDQMGRQNHSFDPTKAMNVSEIEANLKQMNVNKVEDRNDKRAFERLITELGKKTAQNPNSFERVNTYNEPKGEAIVFQTHDSNIVIPKSQPMLSAPTILELLKEEEKKEAMADSQRSIRRLIQNSSMGQRNGSNTNTMNVTNPTIAPQISYNMPIFSNQMMGQDWQNTSPLMKTVRPRNPSNQEMNDNTSYILQNALMKRQQMESGVKPQQFNDNFRTNTPIKGLSNSSFFTPTSVIRKMHSEKDKELVNKSVTPFDEMTADGKTSQQKFISEHLLKSSAMNSPRAIIKSNNQIGANKASLQSPLSPQSDSMSFTANSESSFNSLIGHQSQQQQQQQQLLLQQHLHQQQQQTLQNALQSQSAVKSHQRALNSSNPGVRSFGSPLNLSQSSLSGVCAARSSTPSPNANNNMQTNSVPNVLQMLNQSNVRPNMKSMQMNQQMNQMIALQHSIQQQMPQHSQQSTPSDSRQSHYSQSRPINATNIHQMLYPNKGPNSDHLKNSFDRNLLEAEHMKSLGVSTYPQPRPQVFMNSGHPNYSSDSRFFGQLFGAEALHQTISDMPPMPPVPHQNALTLDDIESLQ